LDRPNLAIWLTYAAEMPVERVMRSQTLDLRSKAEVL